MLTRAMIYRVAYNGPKPIAGRPAVFLGYVDRPFDTRRARVSIDDQEWLIWPGLLINF